MPFWSKKEPEQAPHVEPGMGAPGKVEPNPIKFSDEPSFGPTTREQPITASAQPNDGEQFVTHPSAMRPTPQPINGAQEGSFATMRPISRPQTPQAPAQAASREMPMHSDESELARPVPQSVRPAEAAQPAPQSPEEQAPKKTAKSWFSRSPKTQQPADSKEGIEADDDRQHRWISARRRFIGMLMLLLGGAVAVSVLFDKNPPPPNVTIPLRIPKESSVDISKITVPVNPAADSQAGSQSAAPENPPAPPASDLSAPAKQVKPEETKKEAAPQPPVPSAEDKKAAADKAAEEKKAAEAKRQEELRKAQEAKAKEAKAKEAKAKEEKAAAPKVAKGQYYLQVVALSNESRAKEFVTAMKKAGVSAFLSPVQTKKGKIYRVQAGPFKTAKEAEAANGRLALHGIAGKVLQQR